MSRDDNSSGYFNIFPFIVCTCTCAGMFTGLSIVYGRFRDCLGYESL